MGGFPGLRKGLLAAGAGACGEEGRGGRDHAQGGRGEEALSLKGPFPELPRTLLSRASSLCSWSMLVTHKHPIATSCCLSHYPPVSAGTCPSPAPALCPAGFCSANWETAPSILYLFHIGGAHPTPDLCISFTYFAVCSTLPALTFLAPQTPLTEALKGWNPALPLVGIQGLPQGGNWLCPLSPPQSHMQSFLYR